MYTKIKYFNKLNQNAREQKVPSSRMSRLINFSGLAAGLGAGALNELAKRAVGMSEAKVNSTGSLIDETKSIFLTEENIKISRSRQNIDFKQTVKKL